MLVVQIMLAFVVFVIMLFLADREQHRPLAAMKYPRAVRNRTRRPPPVQPVMTTRRPIQVVAADLRRLARQLALVPSGSTLVRWKALWAAYDGVLVEAAEMLEVHHGLGEQPVAGVARDVERVRVLAALEGAGLVVRG